MTEPDAATRVVALIAERRPRILGISGLPGSGKTTLARAIADATDAFSMSLDDFYLSKAERAARGLRWRGGPGSHDLPLLHDVLDRVRSRSGPVTVPRFDAGRDDRGPAEVLDPVGGLAILEGWFLGYGGEGYGPVADHLDLLVHLDVPYEVAKRRRFEREAALRAAGGGFAPDEMERFWDEALAPHIARVMDEVRAAADVRIGG